MNLSHLMVNNTNTTIINRVGGSSHYDSTISNTMIMRMPSEKNDSEKPSGPKLTYAMIAPKNMKKSKKHKDKPVEGRKRLFTPLIDTDIDLRMKRSVTPNSRNQDSSSYAPTRDITPSKLRKMDNIYKTTE